MRLWEKGRTGLRLAVFGLIITTVTIVNIWIIITPTRCDPVGEAWLLGELVLALQQYLEDSGGVLPSVEEDETLIDALYPEYIELADRLKRRIGMGGRRSYYVFRRELSGKPLADLEEGEPVVVRTDIPLPRVRRSSLRVYIVHARGSVVAMSQD